MPVAIPLAVTAISAAAGALAAVGTISTLTASLIGIGVSVIGTLAMTLLAKPPKIPKPEFENGKQTLRQSIPPRTRTYGKDRRGGFIFYYNTNEKGNNLYIGTVHACHRIDGIEGYWLGDQEVVLDVDGYVQNSPYQDVGGNEDEDRVRVEVNLGLSAQVASTFLTTLNDRGDWTADHRLRGVANSVVQYRDSDPEHHPEIYPNGPPPLTVVFRGALVYDPRDILQDVDDEDTYTWSDNFALSILDFLTRREGEAGVPVGYGLSIDDWIDLPSFQQAADDCEDDIPLKAGGSENRWRCWGTYQLTEEKKNVLNDLLLCCQGTLLFKPDGKIGLSVGKPPNPNTTPIPTLSNDSILHISFPTPANPLTRVNYIKARYKSELHRWDEVEAGQQLNQALIDKFGEESETPQLRFVPSEVQAQRIARAEVLKANPKWAGTIRTNLSGMQCWGERWVYLNIAELNIENKIFEIQRMNLDRRTMTVELQVRSYDNWYSWSTSLESDPQPVVFDDTGVDPIDAPQDVIATPLSVPVNATTKVPKAIVTWDTSYDPTNRYSVRVRWRKAGETWKLINALQGETSVELPTLEDGVQYEVGVQYVGQRGTVSEWSDTFPFMAQANTTAPSTPTNFTAVLGAGSGVADLSAKAPNDQNFSSLGFYRDTSSGFGTEVLVSGPLYGAPLQTITYQDNPVAGTWWYRVKSFNSSGVPSTPSTGISVTTTS